MRLPCEISVKFVLPTIRSILAYQLFHHYSLNQEEIAERLGVTQPAVSQYLKGIRGKKIQLVMKNKKIMEMIDELANLIATKPLEENLIDEKICKICKIVREELGYGR